MSAAVEDKVYVSFPIVKVDQTDDGDLVVWGKATDGSIDSDDQIVDPEWSAKALKDWLATGGNLRVMHSPQLYPAGRGLEVETTDDGHYVKALVVEPTAKTLVAKGVLQAYSVGIARPRIVRDAQAKGGRVVGGYLAELSLVDRPANKNCGVQLLKSESGKAVSTYRVFGDLATALEEAPGRPAGGIAADPVAEMAKTEATGLTKQALGEHDPRFTPEAMEAYTAERGVWLSERPTEAAERTAWETLGKAAGFTDGSDGFLLWLEKRDFDPNVGGGVDRDKIPDEDHVDPEGRRFPIVTPGDVSDAVSSYGRAKPKIPFKQFKQRLTAIAGRKGPEFEKELPEAWKDSGKEDVSEVQKGAKDCPNCGKGYDADSKHRVCENCGADLPSAEKAAGVEVAKGKARQCPDCNTYNDADADSCSNCGHDLSEASDADAFHGKGGRGVPDDVASTRGLHREPDGETVEAYEQDAGESDGDEPKGKGKKGAKAKVGKKARVMCAKCGANIDKRHNFCPECGKDTGDAKPLGKNHKFTCLGCGNGPLDKGEKFCPNCGKENPGFNPAEKLDAPYAVKRMHDWLCAAYDETDVLAEYPSLKSGRDALTDAWLRAQVETSRADDAALLRRLVDAAELLAKSDADAVTDARAALRKSFTDAYPDVHVTPSEVTPGRFTRPYISTGHAPLTATGASPRVPPSSHTPDPGDFDRGPLTTGHEAPSPGDSGDNNTAKPRTGSARTYYTNAAKDSARAAMQAMHDHIASTFPDMCPMAATKDGVTDNRADATPKPVKPARAAAATGEKAAKPKKAKGGAHLAYDKGAVLTVKPSTTSTTGDGTAYIQAAYGDNQPDYSVLKALMDEHTAELHARYADEMARLRAEIATLQSQPDPAQAPVRGVVKRETEEKPKAKTRLELLAEQYGDPEMADYLLRVIKGTSYPAHREAAREQLTKLRITQPTD